MSFNFLDFFLGGTKTTGFSVVPDPNIMIPKKKMHKESNDNWVRLKFIQK